MPHHETCSSSVVATLFLACCVSAGGSYETSGMQHHPLVDLKHSEWNGRVGTPEQALAMLLGSLTPSAGFELVGPGHRHMVKNPSGSYLLHAAQRVSTPSMKGIYGYRQFNVERDWYPHLRESFSQGQHWVSPWAEAHYKLRNIEVEIEKSQLMMRAALDRGDFEEADGLQMRVERLQAQHPIIPREQRLENAIRDENYNLAEVFQKDLDRIKENLNLPKFNVGQSVQHKHRDVRGIVLDVDLYAHRDDRWIDTANGLEKGFLPIDYDELMKWGKQPFYVVLPDLRNFSQIPPEFDCWKGLNDFGKAPLYFAQDQLDYFTEDVDFENPGIETTLFTGYVASPHLGRTYKASPRLRLMQQKLYEQRDRIRRANAVSKLGKW